jgi:hypothetical protein
MAALNASAGRRALMLGIPVAGLAGCAPQQVTETRRHGGLPLRAPERIFVVDLGVLPQDVRLDEGVRERLIRTVQSESPDAARLAAGRQAAGAVAEETAARLRTFGLPAERATGLPAPLRGPSVIVEGHVLAIDQGNSTQRTIIGFGRGQSSVLVEIDVWYRDGAAAPRRIDSFEARAASPLAPGAVGTVGVGAIVGRAAASAAAAGILHGVTEARSADTGSEGRRIGDALALRLGRFFAELGWVPAASVR